jgi:hypothetical protein
MSDEQSTPPTWGSEAKGLANRFALGSGVAVTFLLFGLIVVPALLRERRPIKPRPRPAKVATCRPWTLRQ